MHFNFNLRAFGILFFLKSYLDRILPSVSVRAKVKREMRGK